MGREQEFTSTPPAVAGKEDAFSVGGPALGWEGPKVRGGALSALAVETR